MVLLRLKKNIDLLIEISYLGIIIFIPLCFALFLKTNNVFELNKIILFKILTLVLLFLTFAKILINFNFSFVNFKNNIYKKYYKVLIIIFLYIFALIISYYFSINKEQSLFGLHNRQQGLIVNFYYILFFILILFNIDTKAKIKRIIYAIVFSSLLVSVYGIIQALGLDPLNWIESTETRVTSTFGQPNSLAMYLLLVIPFPLYLIIKIKNKYLKFLYSLILTANLFCLYFTYSLSGWAGLIGSGIITAFIWLMTIFCHRERIRIAKSDADDAWRSRVNQEKPGIATSATLRRGLLAMTKHLCHPGRRACLPDRQAGIPACAEATAGRQEGTEPTSLYSEEKKPSVKSMSPASPPFVISSPAQAGREIYNTSFIEKTILFFKSLYYRFLPRSWRGRNDKIGLIKKTIFILLVIVLIAFIANYFYTNTSTRWTLKAKLSGLVNLNAGSLKSRFFFWDGAADAIFKNGAKRLLFGYGQENQKDILVKYYARDWGVHEFVNVQPDRAHNLILDILLTTGLFGLLTYLALLYLFFYLLIKTIKNNSEYAFLVLCLFSALCAYLIALQLQFTFVVGEIYFWLYLAIAIIIFRNETLFCHPGRSAGIQEGAVPTSLYSEEKKPQTYGLILGSRFRLPTGQAGGNDSIKELLNKKFVLKIIFATKILLIIIISFIIFNLINNQFKLLAADYYFLELRQARQYNQYFGAIKMYDFIKENVPKYSYYDRQYALIMSEWLDTFENQKFRVFGEEKLIKILDNIKDNNYDDIYVKAVILRTLANKDNNYFIQSEANFKKIIGISPEMPKNYIELASLYAKWGKFDEARANYEIAAGKLPDLNHPDINLQHKQVAINILYDININIGDTYIKENNIKKGEEYYLKAVELNKKFNKGFIKLAELYFKTNDLNKAIWYNEKGMEIDPGNYLWPDNLAKIYEKKGNKEKANNYKQKAKELEPKL